MVRVFSYKIVICLFSMVLFFGFGLKATVSIGKWSAFYLAMEDESLTDEQENTKKEKSDRSAKKMWYLESPETDQLWSKIYSAAEAHNKVYLLAKLSAPYIAISIEPPENAAGFLRV